MDRFRYDLIGAGSAVLCALSGGADSMYLLCRLLEGAERGGYTVRAAHFDHQLRPTSGQDAQFVRDWCEKRGVPLTVGSADVAADAEAHGLGIEEQARELRYAFLERTADEGGCTHIATGHHARDNAETVLMNLVRGSGLKGLCGIPEHRGRIVRPMLSVEKDEIDRYLAEHGIPHVEDETNSKLCCTRNRIRHQLLPLLEELDPRAVRHIADAARRLHQDEEALSQAANLLFYMNARENTIPCSAFTGTPRAVALRCAARMLRQAGLGSDSVHREMVMELAAGTDHSAVISVPGGVVRREYERLVFEAAAPERPPLTEISLSEGDTLWDQWTVSCEKCICPAEPGTPESFYVRPGAYTLRPRREGDGLRPPNRPYKTLKKWMIDLLVPNQARDRVPVLALDGTCAAAGGIGVDREALAAPGQPALHITMTKRGKG